MFAIVDTSLRCFRWSLVLDNVKQSAIIFVNPYPHCLLTSLKKDKKPKTLFVVIAHDIPTRSTEHGENLVPFGTR